MRNVKMLSVAVAILSLVSALLLLRCSSSRREQPQIDEHHLTGFYKSTDDTLPIRKLVLMTNHVYVMECLSSGTWVNATAEWALIKGSMILSDVNITPDWPQSDGDPAVKTDLTLSVNLDESGWCRLTFLDFIVLDKTSDKEMRLSDILP